MLTLLIGHRGVGKSQLLERLRHYSALSGPRIKTIDLDKFIETNEKLSCREIIERFGEPYFRQLETKYFNELYLMYRDLRQRFYIAIGAGFNFPLPKEAIVLWVRRETDRLPRVFLDRPRLRSSLGPCEEYLELYEQRDEKFQRLASEIYLMPEGIEGYSETEYNFFFKEKFNFNGILTFPAQLANRQSLDRFFTKHYGWKNLTVELRDDLLSEDFVNRHLKTFSRAIFSFRGGWGAANWKTLLGQRHDGLLLDWAVELGDCSFSHEVDIFSLHDRLPDETIAEVIARLQAAGGDRVLKLAVEIRNFEELRFAFEWQQQDPEKRNLLPRSVDGRWRWFRTWMKGWQTLNFVNEGWARVKDQPSVSDWISLRGGEKRFAAILGSPISHSRTPLEHFDFFSEKSIPIFKIEVSVEEWEVAISFSSQLGLSFAAVTSPLKIKARDLLEKSPYDSINTLYWDALNHKWLGTNTDVDGLREQLAVKPVNDAAIWGGGGVLSAIKEVIPKAEFFSATSGVARSSREEISAPSTLIWAVGRSRMNECQWPPSEWSPQQVIDLNYSEDSPGREYALRTGAAYISGLTMFKGQARKQREFWSQFVGE